MTPVDSPARRFDLSVALAPATGPVGDERAADVALTDYLTRAWLELASPSPTPVPRCPHCDGVLTQPSRAGGANKLPGYFCRACERSFNRLTGTPFARLRNRTKGAAIIPLLSHQTALVHVGERIGMSVEGLLSWLLAFRRYLLELDPSGRWEARVRLGMHVLPHARCARCGFEGGFYSGGFDPQRRRRIRCPRCGRHRMLDVLQGEGQAFAAEVVRDSSGRAVRRQRKYRPDMEMPAVKCAARVDEVVLDAEVRALPTLGSIVLPVRRLLSGPALRCEDPVLSAFLLERIDTALDVGVASGPCPWCGSERTDFHPYRRPSGLPGFRCRACLAYFTRVSNTPLVLPLARTHARRFVTMLGWRESLEAAAQELGVTRKVVGRWTLAWRKWLLVLDPTGVMEARVKLGVPPWPGRSAPSSTIP